MLSGLSVGRRPRSPQVLVVFHSSPPPGEYLALECSWLNSVREATWCSNNVTGWAPNGAVAVVIEDAGAVAVAVAVAVVGEGAGATAEEVVGAGGVVLNQ